MRKYEKPEIEIINFTTEDIMTVSVASADIEGGNADFKEEWNPYNTTFSLQ